MADGKTLSIGSCVGFLLLITIVLLAVSFKDIDADEQGVKFHSLAKTLDTSQTFDQGKFHVWPGQYFIKYKNRFTSLSLEDDKSQTCLANNGVSVRVSVRVQYKMIRNELFTVVTEFGEQEHVEKYLFRLAQDAIRIGCSRFNASYFYSDRQAIQEAIKSNLDEMAKEYSSHTEIGPVQLTSIILPPNFDSAVQGKQEAFQLIESAMGAERRGLILDAQKQLAVATIDKQTRIATAKAHAEAVKAAAQLEIQGIKAEFQAKADAWHTYMQENGLSQNDFISGYMSSQALAISDMPVFASLHSS